MKHQTTRCVGVPLPDQADEVIGANGTSVIYSKKAPDRTRPVYMAEIALPKNAGGKD